MAKEKVYIIATHLHSLKVDPKTGKSIPDQWETKEFIEFVNQIRKKHYSHASVIADYLNRKMITGSRYGITDYDKFEEYVRSKYKEQMTELDAAYRPPVPVTETTNETPVFADQFGNIRAKTVFDL